MVCEDMISALPEDLLVTILSLLPPSDEPAIMSLSKRWYSVWTMLHDLEYIDDDVSDSSDDENEDDGDENKDEQTENKSKKSVWFFLNKSLEQNKAPVISSLSMELGRYCPTDADVGKWVAYAVSRCVRELTFRLRWSAGPASLPDSLYSCRSLVELTLCNKILVDVPSSASLPSLKILRLHCVMYKDDDSVVSFLSSCPVLETLYVRRKDGMNDNVTTFSVKVPSLLELWYICYMGSAEDSGRCLVIDTPALSYLKIGDATGDSYSMEMPSLDTANIVELGSCPDNKFLTSLSSLSSLALALTDKTVVWCTSVEFSWLTDCKIRPRESDWMEPIMLLLHNSPKLKRLLVDCEFIAQPDHLPLSWNPPSSVPRCLASQLETFKWEEYGARKEEEEFLTYILANSPCLKTAQICLRSTFEPLLQEDLMKMLQNIPRLSTESQLIFNLIK